MSAHAVIVASTILLALVHSGRPTEMILPECERTANEARSLQFSIQSTKDQAGNWITTVAAYKTVNNATNRINLDVKINVTRCGGKNLLRVQGTFIDNVVNLSSNGADTNS